MHESLADTLAHIDHMIAIAREGAETFANHGYVAAEYRRDLRDLITRKAALLGKGPSTFTVLGS